MDKVNIAFLVKADNIGGAQRKTKNYFEKINTAYFNKYLFGIGISKSGIFGNSKNEFLMDEDELFDNLEKYKIEVLYSMLTLSKNQVKAIKAKGIILLQNVNFTFLYSREFDGNLIISKTDYFKLQKIHGKLENSYVVYNPVPMQRFEKANKKQVFFEEKRKIVIGRIARKEPSKWSFLIVSSLWNLDRSNDKDKFRFLFAGMPLLYKIFLQKFLSKEMNKNINLLPELVTDEDLAKFYNTIDVFWQTSLIGESFGNVIAESFTFGRPVITDSNNFLLKSGGVNKKKYNAQTELVDNGINGFYCNYPSTFREILNSADKSALRKMGAKGYAKTKKLYDSGVVLRTLETIVFEVLLREKKIKSIPNVYARRKLVPTLKEADSYSKDYAVKMEVIEEINGRVSGREKLLYRLLKPVWNFTENVYLAIRIVGRKIFKKDLETKGFY